MAPEPTLAPNPIGIFEALHAFQRTGVLVAAIQLGVFTAIAEGSTTIPDLAARCQASEKGIRILCDTLVVDRFLTKDGEHYGNTQDAAIFLNQHSPAYMGGVTTFLNDPVMMIGFLQSVTDAVRKGGTMLPGSGSVEPENPLWVTFARAMAPMMLPAARAMASLIPESGPYRVLDIAAGHGMFGIAMAQRNPQAQITAVDWSAVLEVAKENAGKAGVADRVETLPGSAFEVNWGTGYDAALITNFLHHFDAPTNTQFLRRVYDALKPGGQAITLEFVPEDDRVSPPLAARFALTMLTSTAKGDAFTFRELDGMLSAAGFASSRQVRLETGQSLIISTK